MQEDLELENQESIDWERYIGIAKRRIWYFLVPFFTVWLAIWIVSWLMPAVYRSETLILVNQPSVPSTLVPSNIEENLQGRLDSITQLILSRTRLLHIIDQFDLYKNERARYSSDELVTRMQKDIEIDLVRSPDRAALSSFNISYSSHDRFLAQKVTSELTNLFINENLEVRVDQSQNTTKFLEDQLEQARQSLATQEEKVRKFNQEHLGELPTQLQSNLEILRGLQNQLQSEQTSLSAAQERNAYLQSLIDQYHTMERTVKTSSGTTVISDLPAIDQQLDKLRSELADLSSRYTDEYPDVRKVKDQIAKTEQMKQQMLTQLKSASTSAASTSNSANDTTTASSKDTGTAELQSQLKANQIEIANRQKDMKVLQARITELQGQLNAEPIREQQLTELNRGYDQAKADYNDLFKKESDSARATDMERQEQGEHFSIQDPPNLPTKPSSPNRLKFFAVGIIAGVFLGLACAVGAEFLDSRVFTESEFKSLVPAEVMVEIPPISTSQEQNQLRRAAMFKIMATAGVVLVVIIAFGITVVHG
jgi:polysaccharide biosynthesis transport protein